MLLRLNQSSRCTPFFCVIHSCSPCCSPVFVLHAFGFHSINPRVGSLFDVDIFKPDPRLYLHAAAQLGAKPEQCVVIEDSLPGVKAGVAAGMTTIFYNLHNETSPSAKVIEIQHISEINTILAGLESA